MTGAAILIPIAVVGVCIYLYGRLTATSPGPKVVADWRGWHPFGCIDTGDQCPVCELQAAARVRGECGHVVAPDVPAGVCVLPFGHSGHHSRLRRLEAV